MELVFLPVRTCIIQAKCMKYWPDDVHTTLNVGSRFTVTLTSTIPSAEYQISKLQVESVSIYKEKDNPPSYTSYIFRSLTQVMI